jgi:photosystem II stability/assembly factor-like uncharacterized protein
MKTLAILFGILLSVSRSANDGAPATTNNCQWREVGPRSIDNGEGYDGLPVSVSGRVTAIAIAPKSKQLYVGSALGGIWKSSDGGKHWLPLTDQAPSLAVGAIAINPNLESEIYVGTGEGNLAQRNSFVRHDRLLAGDRGKGILKSTDAGRTWNLVGEQEFGDSAFFFLRFDPVDARTIYAGTNRGLFRSRDAGMSWTSIQITTSSDSPVVTSFAIDPVSSRYALVGVFGAGVVRCLDIRKDTPSCRFIRGGLPLSNISRIEVAVSNNPPFVSYAYIADASGNLRGFYHSDDGDEHWVRVGDAPDLCQGQGFYSIVLAVDPTQANVVFIGGAGDRRTHKSSLFKARYIGGQWLFAPVGANVHIDLHALVFDSSSQYSLYVGSDGGIWRADDGGMKWTSLNQGLGTFQIIRIDQDPRREDVVIVGTQDNGTLKFSKGKWQHVDNGDGGYVGISPSNTNVVYDEYMLYKIGRSDDRGDVGTFVPAYPNVRFPRSTFLAPFLVDPADENHVFLGLEKMFVSNDGGKNWNAATLDLTKGGIDWLETHAISTMTSISKRQLVIGTSDGRVWLVSNVGKTWQADEFTFIDQNSVVGYVASITAIISRGIALVASDGSGSSPLWICRVSSLQCRSLSLREFGVNAVFSLETVGGEGILAATNIGVLRSLDLGETWINWSQGLPNTPVFHLQRHPLGKLVRAGSFGRGLWERSIVGRCP